MDTTTKIIVALTFYKITSLGVGLAFAYMGFRLFLAGIWGDSGNVEAQFLDTKLIVRRAAPGTFFALFGTIVIMMAIFTKLEFRAYEPETDVTEITILNDENIDLPNKLPR